jgi:hypothetical protein
MYIINNYDYGYNNNNNNNNNNNDEKRYILLGTFYCGFRLSVSGYQVMNESHVADVDEQKERYSHLVETCSKNELNVSP